MFLMLCLVVSFGRPFHHALSLGLMDVLEVELVFVWDEAAFFGLAKSLQLVEFHGVAIAGLGGGLAGAGATGVGQRKFGRSPSMSAVLARRAV